MPWDAAALMGGGRPGSGRRPHRNAGAGSSPPGHRGSDLRQDPRIAARRRLHGAGDDTAARLAGLLGRHQARPGGMPGHWRPGGTARVAGSAADRVDRHG